jgi:hypothetical protein
VDRACSHLPDTHPRCSLLPGLPFPATFYPHAHMYRASLKLFAAGRSPVPCCIRPARQAAAAAVGRGGTGRGQGGVWRQGADWRAVVSRMLDNYFETTLSRCRESSRDSSTSMDRRSGAGCALWLAQHHTADSMQGANSHRIRKDGTRGHLCCWMPPSPHSLLYCADLHVVCRLGKYNQGMPRGQQQAVQAGWFECCIRGGAQCSVDEMLLRCPMLLCCAVLCVHRYVQQGLRAVNQAMGRVIRHRWDYGAVLLADERFGTQQNLRNMSRWLRDQVVHHSSFGAAIASLTKFYKVCGPCVQNLCDWYLRCGHVSAAGVCTQLQTRRPMLPCSETLCCSGVLAMWVQQSLRADCSCWEACAGDTSMHFNATAS